MRIKGNIGISSQWIEFLHLKYDDDEFKQKKIRSIEFTFTGYWYQSNLITHWNNIALRSIATYYVRIPISDFIKKYWQKKSTKIDNIC